MKRDGTLFVLLIIVLVAIFYLDYTGMVVVENNVVSFDWDEEWEINGSFVRVSQGEVSYDVFFEVLNGRVYVNLEDYDLVSGEVYVDLIVDETVVDSVLVVYTILETMDETNAPTHTSPLFNSSFGDNLTTENLTLFNQSTAELDGDLVKDVVNWNLNGTSLLALNMPFDINSSDYEVIDYSNNANGTVDQINPCTATIWNRTGGFDGFGAYEFDGYYSPGYTCYSNIIEIEYDDHLNLSEELTVESWVYLKGTPSGRGSVIVSAGYESFDVVNRWGWQLGKLWGDQDNLNFALTNGTGATVIRNDTFFSNNLDKWTHLVGVFKGGEYVTMYINGKVVNHSTEDIIPFVRYNNTYNYTIGVRNDNMAQGAFNGTIDDVRIWTVALSEEQVVALYNNRTDLIVSQETSKAEVWSGCITPNDGYVDGLRNCSQNLTILNSVPSTNVTLGSVNLNYSNADIFVNWSFNDNDSEVETFNEIKWTKNGELQSLNNNSWIESENLTAEEVWNVSVRVFDGEVWSGWSLNASMIVLANPSVVSISSVSEYLPEGEVEEEEVIEEEEELDDNYEGKVEVYEEPEEEEKVMEVRQLIEEDESWFKKHFLFDEFIENFNSEFIQPVAGDFLRPIIDYVIIPSTKLIFGGVPYMIYILNQNIY